MRSNISVKSWYSHIYSHGIMINYGGEIIEILHCLATLQDLDLFWRTNVWWLNLISLPAPVLHTLNHLERRNLVSMKGSGKKTHRRTSWDPYHKKRCGLWSWSFVVDTVLSSIHSWSFYRRRPSQTVNLPLLFPDRKLCLSSQNWMPMLKEQNMLSLAIC